MIAALFTNRSIGAKIGIGVCVLVLLTGLVAMVGLAGVHQLGTAVDLTGRSANILVRLSDASGAVSRFTESGDAETMKITKTSLGEISARLDALGGRSDPTLGSGLDAIASFDQAVDELVRATTAIQAARQRQQSVLADIIRDADRIRTDADAKKKAALATEAATEAGMQQMNALVLSAATLQAGAYRSSFVLQGALAGDAALIGQARAGISSLKRHVDAFAKSDIPSLKATVAELSASWTELGRLTALIKPDAADPASPQAGETKAAIAQATIELGKLAQAASRLSLTLNAPISQGAMELKRARFERDETEQGAATAADVTMLATRLLATTNAFALSRSDATRKPVEAVFADGVALEQKLARLGANSVTQSLKAYRDSFAALDRSMGDVETAQATVRSSSDLANKAVGEVIRQRTERAEGDQTFATSGVTGVAVGALLVALAIAAFQTRAIARPIARLTQAMRRLADGKTDVDLTAAARGDEIGRMLDTVRVFRDNAIERNKLAVEAHAEEDHRRHRAERIETLITAFREEVEELVAGVSANAARMQETAESLTDVAAGARNRAGDAAAATGRATDGVTTVAAAAGELSSSISEIGRQVHTATDVVATASNSAISMNSRIADLTLSAERIGSVISLIRAIAEQTNLLALNATIEAARAGDAGRGFAVVAGEVKSLAVQTAKATEDIAEQVAAIQRATGETVGAVQEISATMQKADHVTAAIAAAVLEQGTATSMISTHAQAAATGDAAQETGALLGAVQETAAAAGRVLASARDVTERSGRLNASIDVFLREVRAL